MDASRWSAQSDTRHWRRSRAAACPKPSAGFLLQHRSFPPFSARRRAGAADGRLVARGPLPVAPRRTAEPWKYQRLIEEDGSWRLRDLLATHGRPERDGDRFAARMFAPRPHLERTASAMCYLSPPGTSAADKIEPSHAGRESA